MPAKNQMKTEHSVLIRFFWIVGVLGSLTGCSLAHPADRALEPEPEPEWSIAANQLDYKALARPYPWAPGTETGEVGPVNKFRLVLPNGKEISLREVFLSSSANGWASKCARMADDFLEHGKDRYVQRTSILVMENEEGLFKIGEKWIPITLELVRIFDSAKVGVDLIKEDRGFLTLHIQGQESSLARLWRSVSPNVVAPAEGIKIDDKPQRYILISGISPRFLCTWVFVEDGHCIGAVINITIHPQEIERPTIEWDPSEND